MSREPTSEPGAQRAQYYFEASSVAILDQLEPVSPQSLTLGRGNYAEPADSADLSMKPQVRDGLWTMVRMGQIASTGTACQRRPARPAWKSSGTTNPPSRAFPGLSPAQPPENERTAIAAVGYLTRTRATASASASPG